MVDGSLEIVFEYLEACQLRVSRGLEIVIVKGTRSLSASGPLESTQTVIQSCSLGSVSSYPASLSLARAQEEDDRRTMPLLHSNVAFRRDWHSSGSSAKWFLRQSEGRFPCFMTQSEWIRHSLSALRRF